MKRKTIPTINIRIYYKTYNKLIRLIPPEKNETLASYIERVVDILAQMCIEEVTDD